MKLSLLSAVLIAALIPLSEALAWERGNNGGPDYYPRGRSLPSGNGGGSHNGRHWDGGHSGHWGSPPGYWRSRPGYWRYPPGYWRGGWGYWGRPRGYYWGGGCWDCGAGAAVVGLTFGTILGSTIANYSEPPPSSAEPSEPPSPDQCKSIVVKGITYYNCEPDRRDDYPDRYDNGVYQDRADNRELDGSAFDKRPFDDTEMDRSQSDNQAAGWEAK